MQDTMSLSMYQQHHHIDATIAAPQQFQHQQLYQQQQYQQQFQFQQQQMMYNNSNNNNSALHLQQLQQQQQQQQHQEKDRCALNLNNRACVLVLSKGDYSEANKLFDSALLIHKEHSEEMKQYKNNNDNGGCYPTATVTNENYNATATANYIAMNDSFDVDTTATSLSSVHAEQQQQQHDCDWDNNYDDDNDDDDFGAAMDCTVLPATPTTTSSVAKIYIPNDDNDVDVPQPPSQTKIPRMTSHSRLQSISYCGQQEYHAEKAALEAPDQQTVPAAVPVPPTHQVYSLPIVMHEAEWETAPVQDKSFVLIFNTALCNHLWGMQLMQEYLDAAANNNNNNNNASARIAAMAQHCRETLTVSKLLYKLALENSVSFANGVDKMCYVALYNNLGHVCKTLEGYESMEAQWCDDMLLKAIFWWRDSNSNNTTTTSTTTSTTNSAASASSGTTTPTVLAAGTTPTQHQQQQQDMYLDDDAEIIDAFFDNVYYRIGIPEEIAPAAAA